MYYCLVAAIIPMVVGAAYYHPRLLGGIWMKASGMTEAKIQSGNMFVIFGLAYLFSAAIALLLSSMVVHQTALGSLFFSEPGFQEAGSETKQFFDQIVARVGDKHRTFGHGAVHGTITGFLFVTPIIGIISIFERKNWKYVAVHAGYWIISLGLMGGTLAALI